jgi:sugar phosphate permease
MSRSEPVDPPAGHAPSAESDLRNERPTNIRWLIFALACGTSFVLYLHRYTWNYIGPELQKNYGYSATKVQTLGTLFNVTYGLGQVPSGILCDFIGPHLFLSTLILTWSVALSGALLVQNVQVLSAARLVFGLSQAGAYPSIGKSSQIWFRQSSRTILQGWIGAAFGRGGGAMSSILMGTILIGQFGLTWQQAILVFSALGIAFGVAFLLLFRNSPQDDPRVNDAERALINEGRDPPPTGSSVLPWRRAIRNRSIFMCLVQQFHGAGADSFYSITLGSYFMTGWNVSPKDAGLLISLPLLGGALGGVTGAYLNDGLARFMSRRVARSVVGFGGSLTAAILMLAVILQSTPTRAAWLLFVVKFFMDWNQPSVWGTVTDIGGRYSATVFSIVNTAGTIGSVVVPPLIGLLLDTSKSTGAGASSFHSALAVVAALYLVTALSWLGIDCSKRLEAPATQSA